MRTGGADVTGTGPEVVTTYPALPSVLTAGSIRSPNVWMRETLPRLLFELANIPDGVPILVGPPPRGMLTSCDRTGLIRRV